jgi:hypothetical protein
MAQVAIAFPSLITLLKQGRCYLGPVGVVNAGEDYAVDRRSLGQSPNRKVAPGSSRAMPTLAL